MRGELGDLEGSYSDNPPSSFRARAHNAMGDYRYIPVVIRMDTLYKVRINPKSGQHTIEAPRNAEGYYRRDVSRDGMTITYRKVA